MLFRADAIKLCYIGPQISPEQFIEEHFFLYLVKGKIQGYDGHQNYTLRSGECCIVRKNHLARYNKERENEQFEKVIVVFDQPFLKSFISKHSYSETIAASDNAFIRLSHNELVPHFIQSLAPYYKGGTQIDERFSNVKREELLLILLQSDPTLANILFDFGIPEKLNLEEYMNRHYKFNVSIDRFAYLTGRSLSVFKKDFANIFGETPSRWLTKKRLQEAHFQIHHEGKKPSEIYLHLGFEDLSHFSFAFKKQFGITPSLAHKPKD